VNKVKLIITAAILASLAMIPFVLQRGKLNELRAENERLLARVIELSTELRNFSTNKNPASSPGGGALSREQFNELMRLRAEVSALRKGATTAPVSTVPLAVATSVADEQQISSPGALAPGMLTTNTPPWSYAGYTRPGDTITSMIWAMQQGRLDLLLQSATSEGQAELQRGLASSNAVETMQSEATKVVEVRPSATYPSNEEEAYMTMIIEEPARQMVMEDNAQIGNQAIPAGSVYTVGAQRIEKTVKLQKVGNEWRYAGAVEGRAGISYQ
jgi:hypothetical protein